MREASKQAAEVVAASPAWFLRRHKEALKSIEHSTRTQGRIHAGNSKNKRGVPYARAVHTGRYDKATGQRTKGNPSSEGSS